jgi:hypothetical protein
MLGGFCENDFLLELPFHVFLPDLFGGGDARVFLTCVQ